MRSSPDALLSPKQVQKDNEGTSYPLALLRSALGQSRLAADLLRNTPASAGLAAAWEGTVVFLELPLVWLGTG